MGCTGDLAGTRMAPILALLLLSHLALYTTVTCKKGKVQQAVGLIFFTVLLDIVQLEFVSLCLQPFTVLLCFI